MVYKKCQINGIKHGDLERGEEDEPEGMVRSGIKDIKLCMIDELENPDIDYPYVTKFFEHLAVCNTVICDKSKKRVEYKASSPDELALVNGAK